MLFALIPATYSLVKTSHEHLRYRGIPSRSAPSDLVQPHTHTKPAHASPYASMACDPPPAHGKEQCRLDAAFLRRDAIHTKSYCENFPQIFSE